MIALVKRKYGSNKGEDCLALLSYVAEHRGEPQTLTGLAEGIGIDRMSLNRILIEAQSNGENSVLSINARMYQFEYKLNRKALVPGLASRYRKDSWIIDVERRGYE